MVQGLWHDQLKTLDQRWPRQESRARPPEWGAPTNGRTTWSYNQGVILGGLAELSVTNRDPSLLQAAQEIATAATTLLEDDKGVLHDPCEPRCGADGVQFKGIFVRNLALLNYTQPRATYKSFVDTNADAIWNSARGPNFQLGEVWSGRFFTGNAGSQSSALERDSKRRLDADLTLKAGARSTSIK